MCDDYGGPEFSVSEWSRARKSHDCCSCSSAIRIGDLYHETRGRWDGEFSTFKHCARCYEICLALWSAGAKSIDLTLDCGEKWHDNFDVPEPAELAFLTADEAQMCAVARNNRQHLTYGDPLVR